MGQRRIERGQATGGHGVSESTLYQPPGQPVTAGDAEMLREAARRAERHSHHIRTHYSHIHCISRDDANNLGSLQRGRLP